MPTYRITDPDTGLKVKLTGDSPPTEAELQEIFLKMKPPEQPQEKPITDRLGLGGGEPTNFEKVIFPTASQFTGKGILSSAARVGTGALDLVSAPIRIPLAMAGSMREGGKPITEPQASLTSPEAAKIRGLKEGKGAIASGLLEAGAIATEAAPELLAGGVVKVAQKAVGKKGLASIAHQLGGPSKEAILEASTKSGRKAIKEMSGKAYEVGQQIKALADEPFKYIPEAKTVDKALDAMGGVSVKNTLNTLKEAIDLKPVGKPNKAANEAIKEIYDDIAKIAKGSKGFVDEIPASDFRAIRTKLDRLVNWDDPSFKYLDNAMKSARSAMADDLVETAIAKGKNEYVPAMQAMADKIKTFEQLKDKIGRNPETFANNLMGMGKEEARRVVEEIGKITGDDFIKKAKLLQYSKEFGKEGVPTIFPTHTTGRSVLGAMVAGGSSAIATGIGLPAVLGAAPIALMTSPAASTKIVGASPYVAKGLKTISKAGAARRLIPSKEGTK